MAGFAFGAVMDESTAPPITRFVLLMLANAGGCGDDQTLLAYSGDYLEYIAEKTGLPLAAVERAIREAEALGEIRPEIVRTPWGPSIGYRFLLPSCVEQEAARRREQAERRERQRKEREARKQRKISYA